MTLIIIHSRSVVVCIWSTLQWRHNERDSVSNLRRHDCSFNRLFRRRSKRTSQLSVAGLCEGNSPVTGEFPAQRSSNTENVSIWWRHHEKADITSRARHAANSVIFHFVTHYYLWSFIGKHQMYGPIVLPKLRTQRTGGGLTSPGSSL